MYSAWSYMACVLCVVCGMRWFAVLFSMVLDAGGMPVSQLLLDQRT